MFNSNTRNNMFSVMAHSGFGKMTWKTAAGVFYELPNKAIRKKDGQIKMAWLKRLSNPTIENCMWLHDRGAVATTA